MVCAFKGKTACITVSTGGAVTLLIAFSFFHLAVKYYAHSREEKKKKAEIRLENGNSESNDTLSSFANHLKLFRNL